ncbi:hypothetical protein GCM10009839_63340 [Catenulispora yoronensis]|uniref:Transposase n=1 Tax=Catenulispora yoronensis TaxID=450799 RepID=A0ABN2V549_9ACTN
MSLADRDRLVFEEYSDLGRHLSGVWRRERVRCLACRCGWVVMTSFARAGLTMVGINPNEVRNESAERRRAAGASRAGTGAERNVADIDADREAGLTADLDADVKNPKRRNAP